MEAFALADGPDDETVAAMKQVYLTASTRNAKAKPVMGKLPACILGVLGRARKESPTFSNPWGLLAITSTSGTGPKTLRKVGDHSSADITGRKDFRLIKGR
jgi:hypothetical protein